MGVIFDGAHNGHNAHEVYAVSENGSEHADTNAGVLLEAGAQIGILIALLALGEDALHDAGNPDGIVVAGQLAAISNADNARSYELIALLLNVFNALFALLCKLLCGKLLLKTHTHHDRAHIVVDDGLKNSILGILVGNTGIGHAFKADLRSQRKNIRSVCHCFSPCFLFVIIIICIRTETLIYFIP